MLYKYYNICLQTSELHRVKKMHHSMKNMALNIH